MPDDSHKEELDRVRTLERTKMPKKEQQGSQSPFEVSQEGVSLEERREFKEDIQKRQEVADAKTLKEARGLTINNQSPEEYEKNIEKDQEDAKAKDRFLASKEGQRFREKEIRNVKDPSDKFFEQSYYGKREIEGHARRSGLILLNPEQQKNSHPNNPHQRLQDVRRESKIEQAMERKDGLEAERARDLLVQERRKEGEGKQPKAPAKMDTMLFVILLLLCVVADLVDMLTVGTIGWIIGFFVDGILLLTIGLSKGGRKQFKRILVGVVGDSIPILAILPFRSFFLVWSFVQSRHELPIQLGLSGHKQTELGE